MRLTKSIIDNLSYDCSKKDKHIVWDHEIAGLGIRLWPSGKKVFVFDFRFKGRKRLITLGAYGKITLHQARQLAREAGYKLASGQDPAKERKVKLTLAEFSQVYLMRHVRPHLKNADRIAADIKNNMLPNLGNFALDAITVTDCNVMHQRIGIDQGYPVAANRIIDRLKAMLDKAVEWQYLPDTYINPCRKVNRFYEKSRDRFVTHDEMPRLIAAIDEEPNPYVHALIWTYILTGMRRNEVRTLKWEDVDLANRQIRKEDTKNKSTLYLPLSQFAIEILKKLPRLDGNPYVFCSVKKHGHPHANLSQPWKRILNASELTNVRLHDLRRTVGSYLAMDGHSLLLIGRVLNHRDTRSTQIYTRFHQDPVKEALEKHGEAIRKLRKQS